MFAPSSASTSAIANALGFRSSRGSISETKYAVSTSSLRATRLVLQIPVEVDRAVGPPPRSRLFRERRQESRAVEPCPGPCRLHRHIADNAMNLHLDLVAALYPGHIRGNGEFVRVRELHVV